LIESVAWRRAPRRSDNSVWLQANYQINIV